MISLLGCAESVLANSNQKHLSVHEILDGIMKSDFTHFTSTNAYTTLAAALFTEIQRPGSKFERTGNKFTLRGDQKAPANPIPDLLLCNRRRRRTTSSSSNSSNNSSPKISDPVKLSTTTNPPSRMRTNPNLNRTNFNENNNKSIKGKKSVSFALERNQVIIIERLVEEVSPFPILT